MIEPTKLRSWRHDIIQWARDCVRWRSPDGKEGPIRFYPAQERALREATRRDAKGHFVYKTVVFSYPKRDGKTLQAAAALVSLGASPSRIAQGYYENISDAQMYLLGRAATAMKRAAGGAVELNGILPGARYVEMAIATCSALPEVDSVDAEWLGCREKRV